MFTKHQEPDIRLNAHSGTDWTRWRDIPLAVLAWIVLFMVVFWLASHIAQAILVLAVAALLAYALYPLVTFMQRALPKSAAVTVVYALVLGAVGLMLYFTLSTAVAQFLALSGDLQNFDPKPLINALRKAGISQSQIDAVGQQLINQIQSLASGIVPLVLGTFTVTLDIIIVGVVSVYLMFDGPRITRWLRTRTPLTQQSRISFILDTLERVVGGYIRGQLTLAIITGIMVGIGMSILHVPYAILLGVLAFVLELIPYIGTLTSGALCVLVALSQSSVLAVLVLLYFVGVHIIEGYVLGPRIVGHAVGLHPAISLLALLAGAEIFGPWGALFAAPIAGVAQALLTALWLDWREANPDQFAREIPRVVDVIAAHEAEHAHIRKKSVPLRPGNSVETVPVEVAPDLAVNDVSPAPIISTPIS